MPAYSRQVKPNGVSCTSHTSNNLSSENKDGSTSYRTYSAKPPTSDNDKLQQILSDLDMPFIRDFWHRRSTENTNLTYNGSSKTKAFGLIPPSASRATNLDNKGGVSKERISRPLPIVPPKDRHDRLTNTDDVDFRRYSIVEASDLSYLPRRTSKIEQVLGSPVSRVEYSFRDRSKVLIPSTLEEEPDILNEPREFLSEFANISTFSPFETANLDSYSEDDQDADSPPTEPAIAPEFSTDPLRGNLPSFDPWRSVVYEHGKLRPNKAFERDSFATLASWDGVWSPSTFSEDYWMDEILDHFSDTLSCKEEEKTILSDGTFYDDHAWANDAPVLDNYLISQIAATRIGKGRN